MGGEPLPAAWIWQRDLNKAGFARADAVIAPSKAHAVALGAAHAGSSPSSELRLRHVAAASGLFGDEAVADAGLVEDETRRGRTATQSL